jgi:CRP/FNR family transcriptional regulator
MPTQAPAKTAYRAVNAHRLSESQKGLSPFHLEASFLRQLDDMVGSRKWVKKKGALYRAGDPFSSLYVTRLGIFKRLMLAPDGREQVVAFYICGDLLGADGLAQDCYASDAIALEDSEVWVFTFAQLDKLGHRLPGLRTTLERCLAREVMRAQGMMLILGSMFAEERLAAFLLDLGQRYHALGYAQNKLVLQMTREEIASFLGLKSETLSRLFSQLQENGLIRVQGRVIKLLDLPALHAVAGERP